MNAFPRPRFNGARVRVVGSLNYGGVADAGRGSCCDGGGVHDAPPRRSVCYGTLCRSVLTLKTYAAVATLTRFQRYFLRRKVTFAGGVGPTMRSISAASLPNAMSFST